MEMQLNRHDATNATAAQRSFELRGEHLGVLCVLAVKE